MKALLLFFTLIISTSCNAGPNRLKECGVDIDKSYDGRNNEFVEIIVKIGFKPRSETCSEISEISISNFNTGEWVIFPIPRGESEVALRVRKESIDFSTLTLIFDDKKVNGSFFNEENTIQIYLSEL
jgi:hypothetical protein